MSTHHAVWVSNTDQGTIMEVPIRRDGTGGGIRTAVAGLSGGGTTSEDSARATPSSPPWFSQTRSL